MKSYFRNIRKKSMDKNKLVKYILYAIGEIVLIILGILIAVNINSHLNEVKESESRCSYLAELQYVFELDIIDVKDNIRAFKIWVPKIDDILTAHNNNKLSEVDSLYDKFGTIGNYIKFGQRSRSKIEELKYSNIELIKNRKLKNNILIYQDEQINWLRHLEKGYESIGEDLRIYYAKNFDNFNYGEAIPLNLAEVENDKFYSALVKQRLRRTNSLASQYKKMLLTQKEIELLIKDEISRTCKK